MPGLSMPGWSMLLKVVSAFSGFVVEKNKYRASDHRLATICFDLLSSFYDFIVVLQLIID